MVAGVEAVGLQHLYELLVKAAPGKEQPPPAYL